MWILRCSKLAGLVSDRRAVTSVEYGMIACVIIVAIVGGVLSTGNQLPAFFNEIATALR
jgi:pilus assembly protein Flp/PilA